MRELESKIAEERAWLKRAEEVDELAARDKDLWARLEKEADEL
jgi:hypothetical protein